MLTIGPQSEPEGTASSVDRCGGRLWFRQVLSHIGATWGDAPAQWHRQHQGTTDGSKIGLDEPTVTKQRH